MYNVTVGIEWIAGTMSTIAERYVYNKFLS